MRNCRIPEAGESAGMGSLQTETICDILRSESERGERAAMMLASGEKDQYRGLMAVEKQGEHRYEKTRSGGLN